MGETVGLSSRSSEFISIRQLVFAIADAEKRSPTEIATGLWNLLSESTATPEWLQHHDGVTYRLEPRAQETGWFALRALREGRECHGGWDHKMGFSRPQMCTFFESCGLAFPFEANQASPLRTMPAGTERDAAMLAAHESYRKQGVRDYLARVAEIFDVSTSTVKKCLRRARAARAAEPINRASESITGDAAWGRQFTRLMTPEGTRR